MTLGCRLSFKPVFVPSWWMASAVLIASMANAQAPAEDLDIFLGVDDEDTASLDVASPANPTPAQVVVVDGLRPESTKIYPGEVLRQRGYRTLGDALADIVGVFRRESLSQTRYGMRGIDDGLALEIDGVPQVIDGERDILAVGRGLSLLEVEQVEVVRGPVSAISGAGALAGIVRVKTRRPGLFGVRASATVSAVDVGLPPTTPSLDLTQGERQVEADAQMRFDRVGVLGAVTYRQGIRRPYRLEAVPLSFVGIGNTVLPGAKGNRTVVAAPEEALTARVGASLQDATFGNFFIDLTYAKFDTSHPVSRLSHGLINDGGDVVNRERAQVRGFWNGDFGPARVALTGWVARHQRDELLHLFPAAGVFPQGGTTRIESVADTGGLQARVDVAITENHRIRGVGLFDLTQQDAHVDATDPYVGDTTPDFVTYSDLQATGSGALEYQGDFGFGVRVTAGGVVRWRTGYPLALLPRAALAYSPFPAVSFRVAYAEGSQTPDRYDLAALSQAVIVGDALAARENAQLLPEHSRNLEAGVTLRPSARLSLGADLFGLRHENAIELARDGLAVFPENLAPRHLVGGELYADVEAVENFLQVWTSVYGAAVVDGPVLDGTLARWLVSIEATPVEMVRTGIRGRLLFRPHFDGALLAQRSNVAAGTSAIVDTYITARPFGDALTMQFVVENLLDGVERWTTPETSFANTSIALPAPGRTIWVRVEGRL